jgi:hypothetical protein
MTVWLPCVAPGCGDPAVVSYVNMFGVERPACSEHSRAVRRTSLRERGVGCLVVTCGRYAVGSLVFPDGSTGWAVCAHHRPQVRAANPTGEWVNSESPATLRIIDLTPPAADPDPVGAPVGAYAPDLARCWICGRRAGWEHDTAESRVPDTERHPFQDGPGAVHALDPGLRATCRTEYLEGVQTGRARRGQPLLTPDQLSATYTPFDPPAEPGQPTPRELADIARTYPDLPEEFHPEYALRARGAHERRVARETNRVTR